MNHNIFKGFTALTAAVAFLSSCNLDLTPTDRVAEQVMWESTTNAEKAVNSIHSYIYDVYANQSVIGLTESLTDIMKYGSYNYNALAFIPSEFAYGESTTIKATYVDAYMGYWESRYEDIRRTNEAISNLHKYGKMNDQDKTRLEAELRFIRAYLYFDLAKRYKDIIIYDEDLNAMTKDKSLSSEEEVWNFIQADFQYAADNLPVKAQASYRLDKGVAYAFMTRAMLYAKRYDAVIGAADQVEALGYSLEAKYADSYSKSIADGNTEAILQYYFNREGGVTHSFDYYYTPGGDFSLKGATGGGYGTPTQELVESYEKATGGKPNWEPFHKDNVTATPPYAELEPRFHATVLYNGSEWKGRTIQPFVGGYDGFCAWNIEPEPKGRTTTGYYLRKGVDESHDVIQYSSGVQPFTIIRYAEVLLNKAEALYFKGDEGAAEDIINTQIRHRVGLPAISADGEALFAAIRQERKVEFAFEGLWYWDLRRWGIAHKSYAEGGLTGYQVHGFKITKNESTGDFTYSYIAVDDKDRNFSDKLYRFPLPSSELSNNGAVTQFPEWL